MGVVRIKYSNLNKAKYYQSNDIVGGALALYASNPNLFLNITYGPLGPKNK